MTDDERRDLKDALLMADLRLKTRQSFWETPRNITLIMAAGIGLAGVLGFKLGQREPLPTPAQSVILPPGTTITVPPAPSR
jgi:hypothetical protein